jgi:hypothetical protein
MFQLFSLLCCSRYFHIASVYLNVVYVSHTCCRFIFQMFHQRLMLHSSVFVLQVFCVSEVYMFRESWGHGPGAGKERGEPGPVDGVHDTPGVL